MRESHLPPEVTADIEFAVLTLLRQFGANIRKIILFGSYAKDTYQPDSDIDLAIVLEELPDPKELLRYKQLEEFEHRNIDLLFCSEEQLAGNKFVYRWINEQGVVLYEKL